MLCGGAVARTLRPRFGGAPAPVGRPRSGPQSPVPRASYTQVGSDW